MRILPIVLLLMAACAAEGPRAAGPIGDRQGREQMHRVPVGDTGALIQMRFCRPANVTASLVVINHGSPAVAANRATMTPAACTSEAVSWFTSRGYTVALPLRRGYGASDGPFAENSSCPAAEFERAGLESARDIQAAIDYARTLPGVIGQNGVIVVGQSAGGWGSLALASRNPPGVALIVNMAGGRGGWVNNTPNSNCRPDRLAEAAGAYGRTARIPVLSIYTANDSFFAPTIARAIQASYIAGGGVMEARNLPAFGNDGHGLFFARGGSAVWGPEIERFFAILATTRPGRT
jgi:pimeloyl-ACP methyl ester carboxylesterase